MKKELYLPPETRVKELSPRAGILEISNNQATIEDYEFEDLDRV